MNRLTTLAAAIALTAGGAIAASHVMDTSNLIRARDITGGEIYTLNVEVEDDIWNDTDGYDAIDTNWNEIGEIEDIVLDRSGQMVGLVAEIGGFLDIGDKHVVIMTEDLKLVAVDDKTYAYVTRRTEEQLEEMPGVDEGFWN